MTEGGTENSTDAMGLIEVQGLSLALVAFDALERSHDVRVLEVELNGADGARIKFSGSQIAVRAAVSVAEQIVNDLAPRGKRAIASRIDSAPASDAWKTSFAHDLLNVLDASEARLRSGTA